MDQPITYIGLDVHKDTIAVAHGLRLEIDQDQPSASTVRHTHYTSRPIAELDAPRLDNQCQGGRPCVPRLDCLRGVSVPAPIRYPA
jgi:hypothetical protein